MKTSDNSWGVVATVAEPAPLIAAMVLHHLSIGAKEVWVFMDQPNPEAEAYLRGVPGCKVQQCDDVYWQEQNNGIRPKLNPERQKINATYAYRKTQVTWLIHCDADEYLNGIDALCHDLANAPDEAKVIQVDVVERAFRRRDKGVKLFDGVLRRPAHQFFGIGWLLYGPFSRFLNNGISGHRVGKMFVRTGGVWEIGVHGPIGLHSVIQHKPNIRYIAQKARLMHFDAITPLHWQIKLLRKIDQFGGGAPEGYALGRQRQMRAVKALAHRPRLVSKLGHHLLSVSRVQEYILRKMGMLDEMPCDPANAFKKAYPGKMPSPRQFDVMLLTMNKAMLKRVGYL